LTAAFLDSLLALDEPLVIFKKLVQVGLLVGNRAVSHGGEDHGELPPNGKPPVGDVVPIGITPAQRKAARCRPRRHFEAWLAWCSMQWIGYLAWPLRFPPLRVEHPLQ